LYEDAVHERKDPNGQPYFWVAGTSRGDLEPDSDFTALAEDFVSVTPVLLDFTHRGFLETVKGFVPELE
jgi:5'-nucleotidase